MSVLLLSTPQFAEACGVSTKTVYRWVNAGKVAYGRTAGGAYRFTDDEVARVTGARDAKRAAKNDTTVLLTSGQLAAKIGVAPHTVAGWASEGRIEHALTPGGHRRFAPEHVEKLMQHVQSRPPGTNSNPRHGRGWKSMMPRHWPKHALGLDESSGRDTCRESRQSDVADIS